MRSARIITGMVVGLMVSGCASTAGQAEKLPTVTVTATVTKTVSAGIANQTVDDATAIDSIKHVDACDLLTQKEASQLADLELQKGLGSGEEHGKHTLCTYTRDPNLSGNGQVTLLFGDGAEKAFHVDKDSLGHKFTKVPKLGDEAWEEDGAIFFRVGPNWAAVELFLLNDPALNSTRLRQAVKIAAGRMA